MVDIEKLTKEDEGRSVNYTPYEKPVEQGYITSWNSSYIFVCFEGSGRGQAVSPGKLDFTHS